MKLKFVFCLFFSFLLLNFNLFADENKQLVSIGGGYTYLFFRTPGAYYFNSPSDTDPPTTLLNNTLYLQWYFWKKLGIGFNYQYFIVYGKLKGSDMKYENDYYSKENNKRVETIIKHSFYSINWIPLDSVDLFENDILLDIGLWAGYSSTSSYIKIIRSVKVYGSGPEYADEIIVKKEAKGTAQTFEGFADFKLDSHGIRLSVHVIKTDFERFDDGIKPDGSGIGWYVTYRYLASF